MRPSALSAVLLLASAGSAAAQRQFLTDDAHELILAVGSDFDIGGTGAHRVSESFSTISPTFFFGKGLGDLPDSAGFLRPFAVTGAIGVSFPTRSKNVFNFINAFLVISTSFISYQYHTRVATECCSDEKAALCLVCIRNIVERCATFSFVLCELDFLY